MSRLQKLSPEERDEIEIATRRLGDSGRSLEILDEQAEECVL